MPDAATLVILAVAGLVQGFLGFGFGIVAMAGLTLSHDILHAAGVVNLVGWVATVAQLWSLREHTQWRTVARILPTLMIGVALGVTALGVLDRGLMVQALGLTTIVIAGWNIARPQLQAAESLALDRVVGLVAGALGGAFNTGGPPLIAHLYRKPGAPEVARATLQALFLTISSTRAIFSTAQGLFTTTIVTNALAAIPVMFVGLTAGLWLTRRVTPERFRLISWLALGALGLVLFLRAT